jgi:hypothetical protein
MLTYFINRGGKGLSAERKADLEKAKKLLSEKIEKVKREGSGLGRRGKTPAP